ncbi:MAG: ribosomal-processing cysteine protease Prp [Clostridiales bacterium]|nr:ribosomal-processing cysteine protease Prp [Clostridiales bacterium]
MKAQGIIATVERGAQGRLCGFQVKNHGASYVCSAVSALTLSAVNSLEKFTDEPFTCVLPEKGGGFIQLELPEMRAGKENHDADLLLSSWLLGLNAIAQEYPKQLTVKDPMGEDPMMKAQAGQSQKNVCERGEENAQN